MNTLYEKFDIPKQAQKFTDVFFTENDVKVITYVDKDDFSAEDVKNAINEDAEAYLEDAYKRGIVSINDRTRGRYRLNNFYGFLDVFVVTQKEKYHSSLSRSERGEIDDWYFGAFLQKLDQDYSKPPTEDVILTLEESFEYIDKDDRQLYWTNCDCKCLLGDCGLPTKVCLSYYVGDNAYSDRKVSEPVSKEKAKEIMIEADRAGLMHTWNPNGFCNCCGDCCYLFRAQKVRNSRGIWPKQNYIVTIDSEKCIGCGLCTKRCHFEVPSINSEKKAELATEKCVGCGICTNTCPTKALSLKGLNQ